jgi:hypothetical protein
MLTERFQDLFDQRLGPSPVESLAHVNPRSGSLAGNVLCETSTFKCAGTLNSAAWVAAHLVSRQA